MGGRCQLIAEKTQDVPVEISSEGSANQALPLSANEAHSATSVPGLTVHLSLAAVGCCLNSGLDGASRVRLTGDPTPVLHSSSDGQPCPESMR